jgi:ligand-binding sensor domain-containing protein
LQPNTDLQVARLIEDIKHLHPIYILLHSIKCCSQKVFYLAENKKQHMKKCKLSFHVFVSCIILWLLTACGNQDQSLQSKNELSFAAIGMNQDLISDADDQIAHNILEIFEDSQGDIWFGTSDQGVARLRAQQKDEKGQKLSLEYFTSEQGLCGKTVADIAEDKDGVLWFGTYSDMCRYDRRAKTKRDEVDFIPFAQEADKPKLGWGWKSVKTDQAGNIWVNTHHGIFQYQNGAFVEFKIPMKNPDGPSFCNTPGKVSMDLIDSKGNMWFGTDGEGVYHYDATKPAGVGSGKSFTHYTVEDGLVSNNVVGIVEDKLGHIWFACIKSLEPLAGELGGVCRYDGVAFTTFEDMQGLYENNIHTIYADRSGDVWIGATGFGLYHYDASMGKGADQRKAFRLYEEADEVDLTSQGYISGLQSILEDSKGRLWLGYSGGLFRLDARLPDLAAKGNLMVNVTVGGPW